MVILRRGFKSEANELAREMRRELRVELDAPLDPWLLAEHLGVPVLTLSGFASEVPEHVNHLLRGEPGAFSAVTVFRGRRRTVVHNDAHARGRQANNISHELSHALLHHQPAPALSILGCRDWDAMLEEEASWLGAALLISDEAALRIAQHDLNIRTAAEAYGVSEQLIRMRLNVTGARKRALPLSKTSPSLRDISISTRRRA